MPPILSKPSWPASASLALVTIGSLITVWSLVGGSYVMNHPPESRSIYYIGAGVLSTGVVLLAIGLGMGRIARSARQAEITPTAGVPVGGVPAAGEPLGPG